MTINPRSTSWRTAGTLTGPYPTSRSTTRYHTSSHRRLSNNITWVRRGWMQKIVSQLTERRNACLQLRLGIRLSSMERVNLIKNNRALMQDPWPYEAKKDSKNLVKPTLSNQKLFNINVKVTWSRLAQLIITMKVRLEMSLSQGISPLKSLLMSTSNAWWNRTHSVKSWRIQLTAKAISKSLVTVHLIIHPHSNKGVSISIRPWCIRTQMIESRSGFHYTLT